MGIGRRVNDDLLNELMQDTGCQLRDIGVLADNGQKPVNIGTFAFYFFDFLTEYCSLCLQTSLFRFIIGGQLVKTLVCQLTTDVVLIQPLEDHIQFCNTLLTFRQQLALFGKTFIAFLYIHIHDHLNEAVFIASCEGHDLPQILKDQFLQDNRSDRMWCAAHLFSFAIPRANVVFLILSEAGCPALI